MACGVPRPQLLRTRRALGHGRRHDERHPDAIAVTREPVHDYMRSLGAALLAFLLAGGASQ